MKTTNKKSARTSVAGPKTLKRLPRGSFLANSGDTDARNTKVRISILIDLDVLNFFKERATKPGALAYQTRINQVLRSEMEGGREVSLEALAQDERFIQAVARRVKVLSSRKRKTA